MKKLDPFYSSNYRKQLTRFCLGLGLVSLVYSPFLLSVSMFGLVLLAFFDISPEHKPILSPSLRKKWDGFWGAPSFWALLLVFFTIFFSGLYSDNFDYWFERSRIKLPFLGLPIAFFFLPKLSQKDYRKIALFYILVMVISAIGVTINYGLDFDRINTLIGQGQHIPVPRNHIRFSLGIAIAVILSIGLYFDASPLFKKQKLVVGLIGVLLFFFQHILAVRSGMLGVYLGLLVFVIKSLSIRKYRSLGILSIAFIIILPYLGQKYIPSLKRKVGYMLYDWKMRQEGQASQYSDSGRIASIKAGLKIGHSQPALGVGAGDLHQEMDKYLNVYQQKKGLIPHNEYVFYYAATGIMGLVLFLFGVLTPIFWRKHYQNALFLSIQVILLLSFFVEATLETSTGTGYYLFWSLLGLLFVSNDIDPQTAD